MLDLRLDTDIPQQLGKLALLTDRQFRYAVAQAMTDSAKAAQAQLKADTPRYVDRPTPFTLNATYVRFANPNRLNAEVGFKAFGAKNPAGEYLSPMARGGDRKAKPSEQVLRRGGVIRSGQYIVPMRAFRGDPYGNVPRGTYTMVLSQLRAFSTAGSTMNASQSRRSKAKRARAGEFFLSSSRRAVLYRPPEGRRQEVETAFMVLNDTPNYERQFPIVDILNREVATVYPRILRTSLANELRRAGFR